MDELRIELEVLKSCNSKLEECAKSFSTNFSNFSFDSLGQSSTEILSGVQSAINRCIEEINYLYAYHYKLFNSYVNNIVVVDKVLSRQKGNLSDEDVNAIINTLPNLETDNDITFDKDWDVNIDVFNQVFEEEVSKGKSSTEVAGFVTYAQTQMNQLAIQIQSGTLTEEEKKLAIEQYNEWSTYANEWANSTVDVMNNEEKVSELNNEILQEYINFYNSNIYERDYDGYVAKVNDELNKLRYKIKTDKNMSIEEQNLARKQYEAYRQIAEALGRGYGIDSTAKRQLEELDIKVSNFVKNGITGDELASISETIDSSIKLMNQQISNGNYSEEEIYSIQTQITFLTEYSKRLEQGKGKVSKADAEFENWFNGLNSDLEILQGDSVTSLDIANYKNKLLMEISDNGNLSEIEQNVLNRKKVVIDSLVTSLDEAYNSYKEVENYAYDIQNKQEEYLLLVEERNSLQSLGNKSASVEQRIKEIDQNLYGMATSSEEMFKFAYSNDVSFQINYDFYMEDVNEYNTLASKIEKVKTSKESIESRLNQKTDGNTRKYCEQYLKELESELDSLNKSIEAVAYRSDNILTYVYSNNESFRENYDLKVENQQKINNALSDLDSLYNTKADLEKLLANATYSGERDFYNKALSETNKKISDATNLIGYSDNVSKTYIENQNLIPIYEDELEQTKAKFELIDDDEEKAKLEKNIDFYQKAIDNAKKVNETIGISSSFMSYDVDTLKNDVDSLQRALDSKGYLPTSVREEISAKINEKNQLIAYSEIYGDLNLEELLKSGNDYSNINKKLGNIYDDAMHDSANWDYTNGLSNDQFREFMKVNILKDAALQAYEYEPEYFEERHDFYLNKGNKVYNKINPDRTREEVEQEMQQTYNQLEQQKLNDMVANGDFWGYMGYNFSKTVVEGAEDVGNAVSQTFDELYHYGVSLQQQHYKLQQQYANGEIDAWDLYQMGVGCAYATTAQIGSAILTGAGRFVEGVVDGVVTISTGLESILTLGIDLCTGTNTTSALYETLGNFVGTDYVGNIETAFYETDAGKWIDENALFTHDSAASNVIKGVSEVTASIVTGSGVTKALSSLSKVSSATPLLNFSNSTVLNTLTNTNTLTALAAVKGYGQGMERALNDGASYGDAATYALYSGVWEGAQWYVGGKINSYAQNSLASGANSAKVLTSAVTADTIDSAIEGFVQPALQMTYSDKSYEQLFDENGGWSTVMQQALIGGIMSTVGTYGDVRAARKHTNVLDVQLDKALLKDNAVDSSNLKQTISDKLESKITPAGLKDIDVDSKINISDSSNLKQTMSDKLESKITPAGLKDIDVDSKINISDSSNLKQTISDKLESKITPAGLKDIDVDSKINISDSSNLKQTVSDKLESNATSAGLTKDIELQFVVDKIEEIHNQRKSLLSLSNNYDDEAFVTKEIDKLTKLRELKKEEADLISSLSPQQFIEYYNIKKNKNKDIIDRIHNTLKDDSNERALAVFENAMNYQLDNGSEISREIIASIDKIKEEIPEFKIEFIDHGCSHYDVRDKVLYLTEDVINNNNIETAIHEFQHALDNFTMLKNIDRSLVDFDEFKGNALEILNSHYDDVKKIYNKHDEIMLKYCDIIRDDYSKQLGGDIEIKIGEQIDLEKYKSDLVNQAYEDAQKYWMQDDVKYLWENESVDDFNYFYLDDFQKLINSSEYLQSLNIEANSYNYCVVKAFLDEINKMDIENIKLDKIVNSIINEQVETEIYTFDGNVSNYNSGFNAFSEIVTGIYGGMQNFENNYDVNFLSGHSNSYNSDSSHTFAEAIAEFSRLKWSNNVVDLENIKNLCGEQYYELLDKIYQGIVDNL